MEGMPQVQAPVPPEIAKHLRALAIDSMDENLERLEELRCTPTGPRRCITVTVKIGGQVLRQWRLTKLAERMEDNSRTPLARQKVVVAWHRALATAGVLATECMNPGLYNKVELVWEVEYGTEEPTPGSL